MYRKVLSYSLLAIMTAGLLLLFIPFASSLKPNSDSLNNAPHFDLADLKIGQSTEFRVPNFRIHILKLGVEEVNVFAIPFNNDFYLLPEFNWHRPILPCSSFIQDYGYQCLDKNNNELVWYSYMKWDKDGNYIGENKWDKEIPSLLTPKYKVSAGQVVFLGL